MPAYWSIAGITSWIRIPAGVACMGRGMGRGRGRGTGTGTGTGRGRGRGS